MMNKSHRALLRVFALVSLIAVSMSAYAQALITLPDQPLASAIAQLANASGVNILAPAGLVVGRSAPTVMGKLTVEDALTQLLKGSGLEAVRQDENTWAIRAVPPAPTKQKQSASGELVLPVMRVTGGAARSADQGFVTDATSTATRTYTPLSEIPQSVQVINPVVMKSQQSQSVSDALRNVSSVTVDNTSNVANGGGSVFYVNGFRAPVALNGSHVTDTSNQIAVASLPIAALAGIEVLSGADAILAGSMAPGGVVNVNTKQPQADPVHELTLQTGSYGDYQASLDLAGALSSDRDLTYRFIVAGERVGQTTLGNNGMRDFYIGPSLGWKSGGTKLVVGMTQDTSKNPGPDSTVLMQSGPLALSSPLGRADDHTFSNGTSAYYDFEQKFGGGALIFHSKATYTATAFTENTYEQSADQPGLMQSLSDIVLIPLEYRNQSYETSLDNNLTAKFRMGPVSQTLMAGMSYSVDHSNISQQLRQPAVAGGYLPPVDQGPTLLEITNDSSEYSSGYYIQDQLAWGRMHVLASISRNSAWGFGTLSSQSAWSPNLGILYQLTGNVALYANALSSFVPQNAALLVGGGMAPPMIGKSYEIGTKLNLLDDRLTGNIVLFSAIEKHVAEPDPQSPGFYIISPGDKSRGVSVNFGGSLLPGLKIIGSYTYNDYVNKLYGFTQRARHKGSVWLTYDMQGEGWRGLGGGIGMQARSGYLASDTLTNAPVYRMPGEARVDANIHYYAKNWSATLGVKNLFNRTLYGEFAQTAFVELMPGRMIYLTASHDF